MRPKGAGERPSHREGTDQRLHLDCGEMNDDHKEAEVWHSKDGRAWRLGGAAEIAWIEKNTRSGLAITSAIPPVFEAYLTLELPGSGARQPASSSADWKQLGEEWERHEAAVLTVLSEHSESLTWWLGYLDSGAADFVFGNAPRVTLYADWPYILIEAGPKQAAIWREDRLKGILPDLMFPSDHSWLFSTLWDDDWTCIGGSRRLVDDFLSHPELQDRVHEVNPSIKDATPRGHTAL